MSAKNWALLTTLSLLWGGSFLFVELALRGLPTLTIVWGRVAGAAALLALWVGMARIGFPPRRAWGALLVMGALNNVIPFTLFVLAQGRIEGGLAAIVNATTPLWTVLVAHTFTKDEKLTLPKALGLLLGFAGVLVIAGGGSGALWAIAACLGAALSYGFAGVWGRRFKPMGLRPLQVAMGMVSASALILTPIWLAVDRPWAMARPEAGPVLAVLALAGFCTAFAYILYFRLLADAGAVMLSLVTFLVPVSALALGAVILQERVTPGDLAGLGLVLAGLLAMDGRLWAWRRA